jgi:protein-S-isoprenylcysteine O-methyltransferase Ste14
VNLFSHEAGHIWYTLLGIEGNPHLHPLHIASNVLIVGGFILLVWSWRVLYRAQIGGKLATTGPYAVIRHPQYVAFITIMLGFLLQWPALSTLIMFPILVWVYVRLARREEQEMIEGEVAAAAFGPEYRTYVARTPAFFPWPPYGRRRQPAGQSSSAPQLAPQSPKEQ